MMSKEAKKIYVEEMKKNFTASGSVMIAQYQGLNVNELDELRKELRDKGILFKITKNRITKIAIKETPVKDLEKYFTGPTAAALSSDPITTAKILTKFSVLLFSSANSSSPANLLLPYRLSCVAWVDDENIM